jgi:hypothetical protein
MYHFDLPFHFAPLSDDRDLASIDYDTRDLPVDLAIQGYHAIATTADGDRLALRLQNDRTVATPINDGGDQ